MWQDQRSEVEIKHKRKMMRRTDRVSGKSKEMSKSSTRMREEMYLQVILEKAHNLLKSQEGKSETNEIG